MSLAALSTVAAVCVGHHHVIAGLNAFDRFAHLFNDTCALVTEHAGEKMLLITDAQRFIRVADTGGNEFHPHLIFA